MRGGKRERRGGGSHEKWSGVNEKKKYNCTSTQITHPHAPLLDEGMAVVVAFCVVASVVVCSEVVVVEVVVDVVDWVVVGQLVASGSATLGPLVAPECVAPGNGGTGEGAERETE